MWIPRAIFRELDSLSTAFIWGSGRRRVALQILQRPTREGGMAVPDFESYYLAAQLQWYTQWMSCRLRSEQGRNQSIPELQELVMVLLGIGRLQGVIPNKFKVIRQCWNRCLRKTGTRIPYSPEIPIRMLTSLPHNWDWRNLQNWAELGVVKMGDLYREGTLLPFEELSQEFGLPQGDFLLHRAITAAIKKHWRSGLMETQLTAAPNI